MEHFHPRFSSLSQMLFSSLMFFFSKTCALEVCKCFFRHCFLPQITIDTDAECDSAGEAKITELNIPLIYDTLTFDMENLDQAFDTVIQGILIILIETQNMLAVAALRALIAQSVGSLMCT